MCKGGGGDFISTSYLLSCPDSPLQNAGLPAPQLWILYFLVTVHFTAFNSTFQPSSTLSVLWWYICNNFSHSLQAKLIKTYHHKDFKQHHKTVISQFMLILITRPLKQYPWIGSNRYEITKEAWMQITLVCAFEEWNIGKFKTLNNFDKFCCGD